MNTQPVWSAGTIVAIVAAVIAVLVAFGVPVSDDMKVAIIGLVTVVAPFLVPMLSSHKVTPLVAPKDEDGTPLVRADTGAPTRSATRAMRGE